MRRARADKSIDRERLLKDAFARHAVAIEEYRSFVPRKSRDAYQGAWQDYYELGGSVRFFDYFMNDNGPAIFIQRVEVILEFAAPRAPLRFLWWQ